MTYQGPPPVVEPFFFRSESPLYGYLLRPQGRPRSTAAILCYPWGDEYTRFHRAFRQWSLLLAAEGFCVLRFDFSGIGDSAGQPAGWSLSRWRDDVLAAVSQLRSRVGPGPLALCGLRLGATLGAMAAPSIPGLRALLLWDPICDGALYVQELGQLQQTMLSRAHALARAPGGADDDRFASPDPGDEVLGFPFPATLRSELASLRLTLPIPHLPVRTLLLRTRPDQEPLPAAGQASDAGTLERLEVPLPEAWQWQEALARVLVPTRVVQQAVSWLSGVCP
jgi:hypothetical protein